MISAFLHTSDNNNHYIYDDQRRLSLLVHPEFTDAYNESTEANPYYIRKYAYLKEHGFFQNRMLSDFRTLDETTVRNNIINTRQVVFEVTDSCNLNCTYCSLGHLYEGYDDRIQKNINTSFAINLLKYIFDIKPKNKNSKLYISFYGGEALLNAKFIKRIVDVSKQLNVYKEFGIVYSMTTNATLIHKYIDFLVENKFHLLISLDGNEENHSYRVFSKDKKNSFKKVIENLDMIKSYYPDYFSTFVNFNSVLTNRSSVKEIYEFIISRYQKIPRIAELNLREIKPENIELIKSMFRSKRKSENENYFEKSETYDLTHDKLVLYKELINFLKFLSVNYYISNINSLLNIEEKYLPTGTCSPFSKKIFLTNRNKLLPCEKVNYKYALGSVNKNVKFDIPEITRQYNFYYDHIKKNCQSCYSYRFCGTCLFQINIDNIDKKDFVCENFYDQDTFKNKLHHIFSFLEKFPNDIPQILENLILE